MPRQDLDCQDGEKRCDSPDDVRASNSVSTCSDNLNIWIEPTFMTIVPMGTRGVKPFVCLEYLRMSFTLPVTLLLHTCYKYATVSPKQQFLEASSSLFNSSILSVS